MVLKAAAKSAVQRVLELGGKSPEIVFEDADIECAVPFVLRAIAKKPLSDLHRRRLHPGIAVHLRSIRRPGARDLSQSARGHTGIGLRLLPCDEPHTAGLGEPVHHQRQGRRQSCLATTA